MTPGAVDCGTSTPRPQTSAVYGFGTATASAQAVTSAVPFAGMAVDPVTGGYQMTAADGGVFAFDGAGFYGSLPGIGVTPDGPVVGIAPTLSGQGYWQVASDGGVFTFGDAGFYGSMGGTQLNSPVVGSAAMPTTGLASGDPPIDPWKPASPKLNTPPSEATSQ